MRLHRFYIPETVGPRNEIILKEKELINQIQRVFRLKKGDKVVIFDGTGSDYECKISAIGKDEIILDIEVSMRSRFNPVRDVYLFASIIKKDNFEWITEKATELGVTHIIPVVSERSEKKGLNTARLKKIIIESSEQSGRGKLPKLEEVITLEEAIVNYLPALEDVYPVAFHTDGERLDSKAIEADRIAAFIGPEGGWSEKEIELFHSNGIDVRSMGDQVLRAETAVVSALSLIVFSK